MLDEDDVHPRSLHTVDFMRVTDADLSDEDVGEETEGSATMESLFTMAAQIAAEDAERIVSSRTCSTHRR